MLHNIQRPRHGLAPVLRDANLCTLRRGSPSRPAWQFCAPRQPLSLVCCQSHAGRAGDPGAQRARSSSTKNLELERTRKSELGHTKILSSRSQKLGFRAHKNSGKIGARPYKKVEGRGYKNLELEHTENWSSSIQKTRSSSTQKFGSRTHKNSELEHTQNLDLKHAAESSQMYGTAVTCKPWRAPRVFELQSCGA